jgi:hypothetical protein
MIYYCLIQFVCKAQEIGFGGEKILRGQSVSTDRYGACQPEDVWGVENPRLQR